MYGLRSEGSDVHCSRTCMHWPRCLLVKDLARSLGSGGGRGRQLDSCCAMRACVRRGCHIAPDLLNDFCSAFMRGIPQQLPSRLAYLRTSSSCVERAASRSRPLVPACVAGATSHRICSTTPAKMLSVKYYSISRQSRLPAYSAVCGARSVQNKISQAPY